MKKKFLIGLSLLTLGALVSCGKNNNHDETKEFDVTTLNNMSAGGVLNDMTDFKQYLNTKAHVKVDDEKEFLDALSNAKTEYNNVLGEVLGGADAYIIRNNVRKNETNWKSAITKGLYLKNDDGTFTKIPEDTPYSDPTYTADMVYYEDTPYANVTYTQELIKESTVKIIEITDDLDLGFNKINNLGADQSTYESWDTKSRLAGATDVWCDPDIQEAGISKIKIQNTTDLLIYSSNGSKITHAGFQIASSKNVAIRNINMDEMWMWEDSNSKTPTFTVGDYDMFGWAYFKISFSENIWIDHCTFGKSFDGQIDYSNPCYNTVGTYSKAPYGGTGSNGLHISFCDFKAGDTDKDGYLYKMMTRLEEEYQRYYENPIDYEYTKDTPGFYFALRDHDIEFEDILNGLAVPQKKAFLWNDSGDPYVYNKYMNVSMTSCKIKNIEDRLPKVRGGMAYVYNTLVDNTEYLPYSTRFKNLGLGNAKYKTAGVSQGILAGLDGSVYLESVVYKGILNYLKNNDSTNSNYPTVNGGYMIKNSIIGDVSGSITENNNPFEGLVSDTSKLSPDYFSFKVNGEKTDSTTLPIIIDAYDVLANSSLDAYFDKAAPGITNSFSNNYWTTVKY